MEDGVSKEKTMSTLNKEIYRVAESAIIALGRNREKVLQLVGVIIERFGIGKEEIYKSPRDPDSFEFESDLAIP